ncbi:hypothetical protein F5Y14DRAFT_394942 [Nemania sp. NC0429]|nr:hypothetical protein F5Y14DRAFT_394942 [Nemania sp. NC0429]
MVFPTDASLPTALTLLLTLDSLGSKPLTCRTPSVLCVPSRRYISRPHCSPSASPCLLRRTSNDGGTGMVPTAQPPPHMTTPACPPTRLYASWVA